jgi:SAM-dependent methyltransferase
MSDLIDMSARFKKFHLGCGTIFIKDYLNVGWWPSLGEGTLYAAPNGVEGTYMYNHDLVKGIPATDNSLEVVYHSHLLEHLSNSEGIDFIAACYRVLQPGGILRILVPDLELWSKNYINGNQFFFDEYRRIGLADDKDLYPTNGSIFMGMLHNHGHKMGYDFETLTNILQSTGFHHIRRTMVQESDLPDIAVVEPYFALKALESLCVECYKPT